MIPEHEMHAILNLMLIELDFLLDDKVRTEIEKESPKEQILIKMNVLRKVLAVNNEAELTKLLFTIYTEARKKPMAANVLKLIEEEHDLVGDDAGKKEGMDENAERMGGEGMGEDGEGREEEVGAGVTKRQKKQTSRRLSRSTMPTS